MTGDKDRIRQELAKRRITIVCATQRSGSTMLIEDLRNNGLGNGEEYFIPFLISPINATSLYRRVIDRATNENQCMAVKIMANYSPTIDEIFLNMGFSGAPGALWGSMADVFQDAVWIYLQRRNIIHQAVSRVMAGRTGVSHAVANKNREYIPGGTREGRSDSYNVHVSVDHNFISQHVLNIATENAGWESFFGSNNIKPIRLAYEDIVDDPSYVNLIRADHGLPPAEVNSDRNLLKLANRRSEEIIKSFLDAEVKRHQDEILTALKERKEKQAKARAAKPG